MATVPDLAVASEEALVEVLELVLMALTGAVESDQRVAKKMMMGQTLVAGTNSENRDDRADKIRMLCI